MLRGAHDRTTPAASAHEPALILPDCEEVVLADSAHMLSYEQPRAFLTALAAFLDRHPSAGPDEGGRSRGPVFLQLDITPVIVHGWPAPPSGRLRAFPEGQVGSGSSPPSPDGSPR